VGKDRCPADAEALDRSAAPAAPDTKEQLVAVSTPSAVTPLPRRAAPGAAAAAADWSDPRYQAFALMRLAFTVAPIAFGVDKFFNVLVHWPVYLAPWIDRIAPGSAQQFMYVVGVVEIAAGISVALKPRYGAYLVAGWLGGIIVDLLTHSGFYDIAFRDFGLLLGALTLARLAAVYDPPVALRRRG
jgi:hypothetical protein